VGAKQPQCTFKDLDTNFNNDMAFTNFRVRLVKFFNSVLKWEELPDGRRLVLQQEDTVTPLISVSLLEKLITL
jgi:hypothetical protein